MSVLITVPVNGSSGVWRRVCVCVYLNVWECFDVFCLRKARDKKGETPHFLSPPPPSLVQSTVPVRRWWWRLGSSKTSGVSQAAWWAVLGWRESWMADRCCWCRCGLGSALDSAVYCFPQCWMCWMQGFHVFCTTQTTTTSGRFKTSQWITAMHPTSPAKLKLKGFKSTFCWQTVKKTTNK